jgi:excinuclease ABC subunit B
MYADKITGSMQRTIDETERRREKQLKYNAENGIVPQQIKKDLGSALSNESEKSEKATPKIYGTDESANIAADPVIAYMSEKAMIKAIENTEKQMKKAAKDLDFRAAAEFRDEMFALRKVYQEKFGK